MVAGGTGSASDQATGSRKRPPPAPAGAIESHASASAFASPGFYRPCRGLKKCRRCVPGAWPQSGLRTALPSIAPLALWLAATHHHNIRDPAIHSVPRRIMRFGHRLFPKGIEVSPPSINATPRHSSLAVNPTSILRIICGKYCLCG
jgi:hypothetical protein